MYEVIDFVVGIWNKFINLLDSFSFNIGGITVGLFTLILGFIAISFVVKVFWKGV